MIDDPGNTAQPLDEQLVAYLDGELDPEGRRRIEELLATDADVRRRVQEMERTWELLDGLDVAPAGERFTQTTLEMVAVAARQDVEQSMAEAPRRRRRRRWLLGGGLLAAAAAGFFSLWMLWPDPNRELIENLPVLENLDEYRQIDDVEFLNMLLQLDKDGLLPKETGEAPREPAAQRNESLDRRQLVANMSLGEKEQLLRLQERFDALDADQQKRLSQLDDAVQRSANGPQLRQVMLRYHDWLKTLPSYTRAELAELPPDDRIKSVKERLETERTSEAGKRLERKDVDALQKWTNAYASQHEAQFLKTLREQQRKRLGDLPPAIRHQWVFLVMLRQATGPEKPPGLLTNDDLARLRETLSPEAAQRLQSWQQVSEWMRRTARQRFGRGPASKPNDEALANFFEHELPEKERDRLLSLPGEDMQRELLRQYLSLSRTGPRDGSGRLPDGFQRGPRPDRSPPKRSEHNKESEPRPTPAEKR
jgi:hypothetical protein